jgi:Fe-S cluster assembly ATP-binding protein
MQIQVANFGSYWQTTKMKNLLSIKNLHVSVEGYEDSPRRSRGQENKEILRGISLEIAEGETHTIMGPNGSGKSTLALTLMGHPSYKIEDGSIIFDEKNKAQPSTLEKIPAEKRAQAGIFLSFQNPCEIEGVSLKELLFQAYQQKYPSQNYEESIRNFEKELVEKIKLLEINPELVERSVNYQLSGGEKKQTEILQMAILKPKLVILDEIDSGLDVDALKKVCACLNKIKRDSPKTTISKEIEQKGY